MKLIKRAGAICFLWWLAGVAHAGLILDEPIIGGDMLVASDGNVFAQFLGSRAGYFNTLYLDSPGEAGDIPIFNKYSPIFDEYNPDDGGLFDLGWFTQGTELIFRIDVRNTRLSFYTGDGSLNPDGLAHVEAVTSLIDETYVTTVGFEDLLGGGDLDYNDFMFSLTNVIDPPQAQVSEPPIYVLLMLGLIALYWQSKRAGKLSAQFN